MVRPLFLGLTITNRTAGAGESGGLGAALGVVRPTPTAASTGRPQRGPHSTNIFPGAVCDGTESALSVDGGGIPDSG